MTQTNIEKDIIDDAIQAGFNAYSQNNELSSDFDKALLIKLAKFAKLCDARAKASVGGDNLNTKENIDREDWLRISKSGCSLKLGWQEKRIVASVPDGLTSNCNEQWLEDAQRLCDGWNSLSQADASKQAKDEAIGQVSAGGVGYLFKVLPMQTNLFTSPQQPQTVADALEEAAKISESAPALTYFQRESNYKIANYIATEIRNLITTHPTSVEIPKNIDALIYEHTRFNVNQASDTEIIKSIKSLISAVINKAPSIQGNTEREK